MLEYCLVLWWVHSAGTVHPVCWSWDTAVCANACLTVDRSVAWAFRLRYDT